MISTREWITDSRHLNSYDFTDDMKEISAAALYMDSSSLANRFRKQNSDAFVYSAFCWRRYLLARYVFALRFL